MSQKLCKALYKYVLDIKKGEQNIDVQRQRLCSYEQFEPYQAFIRIDIDGD